MAAVMVVMPMRRSAVMARLHSAAMTWGALPMRTWSRPKSRPRAHGGGPTAATQTLSDQKVSVAGAGGPEVAAAIRTRRARAAIPAGERHRPKWALVLEMLEELSGRGLRHRRPPR